LYQESLDEHDEQLAHHYEESCDVEQAIVYLFKAGQKAKRSYANVEAIAHFNRALTLLGTLPETTERDRQEFDLQLALGVPLVHVRGHSDPQVKRAYSRAVELCTHLGDALQRLQAWVGLRRHHLLRGECQKAHTLSNQLLSMAQEAGDPLHVSWAHMMQGEALYWIGRFAEAREYLARGFELCDLLPGRAHIVLYGNDAQVACLMLGALATWHLGYPDQALTMSREALDRAGTLAHPFTQVFVLYFTGMLHWLFREAHLARVKIETMMPIALERGFALFSAWGKVLRGWALGQQLPDPAQKEEEARELLRGVYDWFTEGFDTPDLQDARTLLEAMAQA
jgi:tetratricopeptide (TPR) repeat protein